MRLVMAVSADDYVARSDRDDMRWTGPADKAVFRILTSVGYAPLAVSWKTSLLMPDLLPGRDLFKISRSGVGDGTLEEYHDAYPDGWLLGGQTLSLAATGFGLITEVHLCKSSVVLTQGIRFDTNLLVGLTARMATEVEILMRPPDEFNTSRVTVYR